jgi:hypothetical protein
MTSDLVDGTALALEEVRAFECVPLDQREISVSMGRLSPVAGGGKRLEEEVEAFVGFVVLGLGRGLGRCFGSSGTLEGPAISREVN